MNPALACVIAVLAVVVAALLRQMWNNTQLRARCVEAESAVHARDAEIKHVVQVRLPAVASTRGAGLRRDSLRGSDFAACLDQIIQSVVAARAESEQTLARERAAAEEAVTRTRAEADKAVAHARAEAEEAVAHARAEVDTEAKAAVAATMRTLQSLASEQQLLISTMQERHDDPEVLQDLMAIDHSNAQFGRRVQVIAVLCGAWPGLQRSPASLSDVVRGATSRIRDYPRVQLVKGCDTRVEKRVVEPAVLAVAELLDNAARYSHPDTGVHVEIEKAHNGMWIGISDAGSGMTEDVRGQAEALMSGRHPVAFQDLGDPPRVGFAAIGVLARKYGITVKLTASAYGGVQSVVFLDNALLLQPSDPEPPAPDAAVMQSQQPMRWSDTDLPQRQRKSPRRADTAGSPGDTSGVTPRRTVHDSGAALAGLQNASNTRRTNATAREEQGDPP